MNSSDSAAPDALIIRRSVVAPPEEIWRAWTEPQHLRRWWWPERFETTYRLDVRPGGSYRFTTVKVPPVGVLDLSGTYLRVQQPSDLEYTWRWESDLGQESHVRVRFEASGQAGTMVTVRHDALADSEDRDNHIVGWNDCLDRLEKITGDAPPGT